MSSNFLLWLKLIFELKIDLLSYDLIFAYHWFQFGSNNWDA